MYDEEKFKDPNLDDIVTNTNIFGNISLKNIISFLDEMDKVKDDNVNERDELSYATNWRRAF